ncbi:MAG: hypothetical protein ACXQTI_08200 [Candidatus Nezhaarchaeales archaeon]
MDKLSYKHKYFIDCYTIPDSGTFLNAKRSYMATYPNCKELSAEARSAKLMRDDSIKIGIVKGLEPIHNLSKEGYIDKLEAELLQCTAPATRARLLELIGKVHALLSDREVNTTINTVNIKDLRSVLDERQALLEDEEPRR